MDNLKDLYFTSINDTNLIKQIHVFSNTLISFLKMFLFLPKY